MQWFRRVLFWSHLVVGVAAGAIILLMSVTGVLLTYQRQITAWADVRGYEVAPPSGAQRLPAGELLARVRRVEEGTPTTLTVRRDPRAPTQVAFGRERTVFVDPYSGAVLGHGSVGVRRFFTVITDWHRWLGRGGESRPWGKAVTGAANLGFLFLVVSGLYLWFPRRWTGAAFRNVLWYRRGLRPKARDFNWHNVTGFWSLVPLFVVVLSGVVISYRWAGNAVYQAYGETPPPRPGPPGGGGGEGGRDGRAPGGDLLAGTDPLWAHAERRVADWRTIRLQLPTAADAPLTFTIDRGTGGQPQKQAELKLDRGGQVVEWKPFSARTPGARMRSLLRFAHTGEVLGIPGQTLAGLVSAVGALLVWTGIALAWRRYREWSGRKRGAPPRPPKDAAVGRARRSASAGSR